MSIKYGSLSEEKKAPPPAPPRQTLSSVENCAVEEQPDGSLIVHFRVDVTTANRLKKKAYNTPMADFLWDNIIKRNVVGAAF
jgi:hypothetical protein